MSAVPDDAAPLALARALLAPRSVALVGASGDAAKNTARPQRYLRAHGWGGRVLPINPTRSELFGLPAWPDIASAPGPIDHAFVMVPAAEVEPVVEQCCARGVPLVTIYSDGFAESGAEGAARQRRIVEAARRSGTRLIGPNSIGTIVPPTGLALSANAALDLPALPRGRLAVVSQSGSIVGAILSRGQARGFGFSALVSIGNEADLTMGEVVDALVDDEATDVVMLFLETVRDAARLAAACRRAFARGKPMVTYYLGHSALGRSLALTHTGALAGDAEAVTAWLDAQGVVRVDQFETLLEIAPLVRQVRPPAARRLGVLSTTGGGAAMVVDRIGSPTLQVLPPTPAMIDALAAQGIRIGAHPVTDLTLAGTRRAVYEAVLGAYLGSDAYDSVLAVVGNSAQFHPQHAVQPIVEAQRGDKALLAFASPAADEALAALARAAVPAFRTPDACADALRALARWQAPVPAATPDAAERAALEAAAHALRTTAAGAEGSALDEADARRVFAQLGVDTGRWCVIAGGAPMPPEAPPLPAAVKVLSPAIAHKSDIGGVRLDCATPEAVRAAVVEVTAAARRAAPAAAVSGALVQHMERGVGEAIVGYRLDAQVGPMVLVGVGGVGAEIYRDAVLRPAPVSLAQAQVMIDSVRGFAGLRGWRGAPPGDLDALARAVRAVSLLACLEGAAVAEAEINPLLVRAQGAGCVALDALLVLTQGVPP